MKAFLDRLSSFGGRHPRWRRVAAWLCYVLGHNRCRIHGQSRVHKAGVFLQRVSIDVEGDGHEVRIMPNARIFNLRITLRGSAHRLVIGEDCYIKAGSFCMEDTKGSLVIGRDTTIEEAAIAVTEDRSTVTIGSDCMLAFGIDIRNGDSHGIYDKVSGQRINKAANITIGDHVWIAAHASILKGVSLGDGCIIGSRSLVTGGEIPANSLAVGVPARIIRTNVVWTRQR
jgi:acetyltransferase-like isoleucine patch superfamily enzyme